MRTFLHESFKDKSTALIAICSALVSLDDIILIGPFGILFSLPLIVTYMIQPNFQSCFIRFSFGYIIFSSALSALSLTKDLGNADAFLVEYYKVIPSSFLNLPLMFVSILLKIILIVFGIQFFEYSKIELENAQIPMYNNYYHQAPVNNAY